MSDFMADFDLQTLGIIALCLGLGFVIVWTVLSARSADRAEPRSGHSADEDSKDSEEFRNSRES